MTKLNFYGAETGDATELLNTAGTFDAAYTGAVRSGTYSFRSNPTTTGTGGANIAIPGATGVQAAFSVANLFSTFYFRYATKPAANDELIYRHSDAAASQWEIRLNSAGNLALYQDTTNYATGTTVLSANTWYRIDYNTNNTANTQEVKIDGAAADMSAARSMSNNLIQVAIGKLQNRNGNTVDFIYDDWCLDDAAYPGAGVALMGHPIGAGSASAWTLGTGGKTFAEVDEVTPSAADYIRAAATDDNLDHTFDMATYATIGAVGSIGAVKSLVQALTASISGASTVAHRILPADTPELTALELTVAAQMLARVDATDPVDQQAWTRVKFNLSEVGMAANTLAQTQDMTWVGLGVWSTGVAATAVITGTATATINEGDIVTGGKTVIITLTNDTWIVAAGFDAERQNIINGMDSAQSELLGWDVIVKGLQGVAGVVRTSDTVVTITLDAQATYNITAQETITVTVPASAVDSAGAIVATPTFTVDTGSGPTTALQDIIGMGVVPFAR